MLLRKSGIAFAFAAACGVVSAQAIIEDFSRPSLRHSWAATCQVVHVPARSDRADTGFVLLSSANRPYALGAIELPSVLLDVASELTIEWMYAAWGGTGADGMAIYLFDPQKGMRSAQAGSALGYCGGPGAYLAIATDQYGGFAAGSACGGGDGALSPQSLVVRGPQSEGAPRLAVASMPGGAGSAVRAYKRMKAVLIPKIGAPGFLLSVESEDVSQPGSAVVLMKNVDVPYAPSSALSFGIAGATGGLASNHEVKFVRVTERTLNLPDGRYEFEPRTAASGERVKLRLVFRSKGGQQLAMHDGFTIGLGAGLDFVTPAAIAGTCLGELSLNPSLREIRVAPGLMTRQQECFIDVALLASRPGRYRIAGPFGQAASVELVVR